MEERFTKGSSKPPTFSVGICAAGSSPSLASLASGIIEESASIPQRLEEIVVVASGCPPGTLAPLRRLSASDRRVLLIEEAQRNGKASAVNRIAREVRSDYLVFVNSDAVPDRGSIGALLDVLSQDSRVGAVSAAPYIEVGDGPTASLLTLMWAVHNTTSLRLNHDGTSNHASDELMAVRRDALAELPPGTVNDGAYIAGTARRLGFSIRFLESARVRIDAPKRLPDIIGQRRRIIFGHFKVFAGTGELPRNVESLLVTSPGLSLGLLFVTLARSPKLLLSLPVALVSELTSTVLALFDLSRKTQRHVVWGRYAGAS
jgi:cellulose synthase/poly-beta-1,6-N-acetylglucosamine synthase-like glycosyltransferase